MRVAIIGSEQGGVGGKESTVAQGFFELRQRSRTSKFFGC